MKIEIKLAANQNWQPYAIRVVLQGPLVEQGQTSRPKEEMNNGSSQGRQLSKETLSGKSSCPIEFWKSAGVSQTESKTSQTESRTRVDVTFRMNSMRLAKQKGIGKSTRHK